jgi:hypothetical protein
MLLTLQSSNLIVYPIKYGDCLVLGSGMVTSMYIIFIPKPKASNYIGYTHKQKSEITEL